MKKRFDKKGIEMAYLAYWIIALVLLVVVGVGYLYLRKTDSGAIAFVKNLFKFGRGLG
ncbi:MAG: hypothetical protein WC979_05150 [Candidatus Pacearchaeota archaeon]|jgi:hypothetical protein